MYVVTFLCKSAVKYALMLRSVWWIIYSAYVESAFLHSVSVGRLWFPQINSLLFCSGFWNVMDWTWVPFSAISRKCVYRWVYKISSYSLEKFGSIFDMNTFMCKCKRCFYKWISHQDSTTFPHSFMTIRQDHCKVAIIKCTI